MDLLDVVVLRHHYTSRVSDAREEVVNLSWLQA